MVNFSEPNLHAEGTNLFSGQSVLQHRDVK